MAIDARIPLGIKQLDVSAPIQNIANAFVQKKQMDKNDERYERQVSRQDKMDAQQTELRDLQIANEKIDQLSKREQQRFESVIYGSAELGIYLESGDLDSAEAYLLNRKKNLGGKIASGEDVDTEDTDFALNAIRSGDPEAIKDLQQKTGQLIQLGQVRGILSKPQDNSTSAQKDFLFMQGLPDEKKAEFQGMSKKGTTVNVNTAEGFDNVSQKEAAKKVGQGVGNRINTRTEQAMEAINQNNEYAVFEEVLKGGTETGFGQETLLKMKSLAQTFGIESEGLAAQELVRQIGSKAALRARNPESGLGLPGATSNRDLAFLKEINPNIVNTREGNLAIIEANRSLNNLKLALVAEQNRLIAKNNGLPPQDIDEQLIRYANDYDVLPENLVNRLKDLGAIGSGDEGDIDSEIQDLEKELGL